MQATKEKLKINFFDRRIISGFISNLFLSIIAIYEGWNIFSLMWVYWAQSVIIGITHFFLILSLKNFSTKDFKINDEPVEPTPKTRNITAFFFLFQYNFFHLVYAVFLSILWLFMPGIKAEEYYSLIFKDITYIIITLILFIISQIQVFFETKRTLSDNLHIGTLMFFPYYRLLPIHITIILSAFIGIYTLGSNFYSINIILLIVFSILKIISDVIMQNIENNKFSSADY